MAISPLSKPAFARSSALSTSTPSPISSQPRGMQGLQQGPQQGSALRRMLMSDGFDAPVGMGKMGAGKMGGLEKGGIDSTMKMLTQMTDLLAKATQMLASELGRGIPGMQGASAPQMGGMSAAGAPSAMSGMGAPSAAAAAPAAAAAAPAAPSAAAAAPAAPAAQGASQVAGPEAVSAQKGSQVGERTMTFVNDGNSPMNIQFTPNAGDKAIDGVTLKPGETKTVAFPDGWSGNFRSTAGDGKNATLGEVKFNGGGNNTYYDVSYIEGANAAMTIKPESGGRLSGTMDNLLSGAPDSIKAKDANGDVYGIKKTTTSNVQDGSVVDYYRKHVGADQGYVIPTDDASTLGSKDSHLVVHMKNLT
ncbi:hypothetical protein [Hyalangium minutum]|uniref:Uncharacterized protein n=1 Tax=Hyalangium minutum TaxID=394096 RepID=A0A085WL77_9BACT|nr:hypothetical protein [Hyalangium minutum]KFE68440.1 hypothetical protein DB31_7677 [Hyalangium minutum]